MHLALYQPDIPQNLGSILRLCACMDVVCHIIEPCGFILDDKRMKRVGMDYIGQATLVRHPSWAAFLHTVKTRKEARIVLLSTKATQHYCEFDFRSGDILLMGRESAGVPAEVAEATDAQVRIPMAPGARSLNIVQAASMALGESLRQVRWKGR